MRRVWLVLLALFLVGPQANAAPAATGPSITFSQGQLSYLRDPGRQLTLSEAQAAQAAGQFKRLERNLGLGYIPDAVWLHLALDRAPGEERSSWLEIMPPYVDDIRLFHVRPDGRIDERRGGDGLPQAAKEEPYRGTLFKLELDPGRHEFYLRIQTTSTMAAIVTLWQPEAFASHGRASYFAYGLYFSLILTVLLFNAANWLVSRRRVFLVYVGYLFLNALQWLATNGFVAEFLFPEHPALANWTLGLTLSLAGAMAFAFYIFVLELKRYHPFLYRFSQAGIVTAVLTAGATTLGYYTTFAPLLLLFGMAALCTIPWPTRRLWATRDLWARLLAVAYVSYGVLLSINILGALALLPFNQWNIYAGMASNVCHILLLHFGILLHYRRVEADHAAALEKSTLAERQASLEKAHREEQEKLLAMIGHEVRTPLAVIDAATQSLQVLDESPSPARAERYSRIRRSSHRLALLLDLVNAHNAADPGDSLLKPTVVPPRALTEEVVAMLDEEQAKRCRIESTANVPDIDADPRLLRFAWLNLIDNACKYSTDRSPVHIRIASEQRDRQAGVVWVIQDAGPGIPAGMEHRIFDKFQRGGEYRDKPGLGLGLFLARRIIEQHGGTLHLQASEHGACFVCWLPAIPGRTEIA